ncbi:MAG TPA: alpha/beta fold hydrolase [Myxococcota bacterium]
MDTQSFALTATRIAFSSLGAVAPEPMAAWAERLYMSPRRHETPERERAVLEDATALRVDTPAGQLAAWRWQPWFPWERSARGTVLLAHGWEGRASQLGSFVAPLVARGFSVLAADAPAHGASPGDEVDLPLYSACLRAIADQVGDVRAIVAHSFGCAASVFAMAADAGGPGLGVDAAVLVSPPHSLERFADEFARMVGLTSATEAIFRARLEVRFGREWWRTFSLDERARKIAAAALVIHDDGDAEVPPAEGAELARAFPAGALLRTQGLGHRRILRDVDVVERAAAFLDRALP